MSKSSSRWGSFLQQAVAGVESRLDNILAEDDDQPKTSSKAKTDGSKTSASAANESARSSGELSRESSGAKRNDRLQERLAKAVVNRNAAARSNDDSNPPSQAVTPAKTPSSPRASLEGRAEENTAVNGKAPASEDSELALTEGSVAAAGSSQDVDSTSQARSSVEVSDLAENDSIAAPPSPSKVSQEETAEAGTQDEKPSEELVRRLRSDYESAELRRQEEVHEYMERIEALQAKLQYLTREAAESARISADEASAGSIEQKLAQRDEQISLLMEEGQNLSQNELKLMTTLKKLRAKSAEDEKKLIQAHAETSKAEKAKEASLEKARAMDTAYAEEAQRVKRLEKDLERARSDLTSRSTKVGELQSQLNTARANAATEELTKTKRLLEEERSKSSQAQEDLSTLKIEKTLSEDRHRARVKEVEENIDREKERTRVADLELRGEIGILESRLETYRAQAEEISSGSSSDTQAKLFRQIETLQTQYTAATENWRGIESSLLARIAGLEKERDELGAKESDLRRKNREASTRTRRAEDELEQASARIYDLDENLNQERLRTSTLQASLEKAQAELDAARTELQASQDQGKTLQQEIERKDAQILNTPASQPDPVSPGLSSMRSPTERINNWGRRHPTGSAIGLKDLVSPPDRPSSRKSPTPVSQNPFVNTRQNFSHAGSRGSATQTPSVQTEHQDDPFDGVVTPATPEKTINEMFSVSTAAAGPSVQLVERMSAAVRRLESEKAASKEDLDRLHSQRDEAREQVVALMREVDEKRNVDTRVAGLEKEVATLNQRYQTTLELLGEKSERVEELQADIEDMKEIYRETLEKNIR